MCNRNMFPQGVDLATPANHLASALQQMAMENKQKQERQALAGSMQSLFSGKDWGVSNNPQTPITNELTQERYAGSPQFQSGLANIITQPGGVEGLNAYIGANKQFQPTYDIKEGSPGQFLKFKKNTQTGNVTTLPEQLTTPLPKEPSVDKTWQDIRGDNGKYQTVDVGDKTYSLEQEYINGRPTSTPPKLGRDVSRAPNSFSAQLTPEEEKTMAQGLAHYEVDMNELSNRDPGLRVRLFAQAKQLNPAFSTLEYKARNKLYQSFAAGKDAGNVQSINTVLGHIGDLDKATQALNNGDLKVLNSIAVFYGKQTGNDAPAVYETIRNAVANEMATALKSVSSTSSGTDIGLKEAQATMLTDYPAKVQHSVNVTNANILLKRLEETDRKYFKIMRKHFPVLSPDKAQILEQLTGKKINPNIIEQGFDVGSNSETIPTDEEIEKMTPEQLQEFLYKK